MKKKPIKYICQECGAEQIKWSGQCPDCKAWNSMIETINKPAAKHTPQFSSYAGEMANSQVLQLNEVEIQDEPRITTNITELDRVLGGGLVQGSVVLIGGDPGIGKSTLLLQALVSLGQQLNVLYVTGEESLQQVSMRATRLELKADTLKVLSETSVEAIIEITQKIKPQIIVIDSIQTIFTEQLQSAPGSVSQLRESTAILVRFAKITNTALFLVGHVTKEGTLAGPRVLEHMVDTVLYFEGDSGSRFRLIRACKNRFGAVNELGIFAMTEKGLREVNNPSAIFLSRHEEPVSGSMIMVTMEGSRPLLVEVQALVDENHSPSPRRVTLGLEHNRLSMLIAVLNRHGGIAIYDHDIYVNVVGGVRILETAADLPVVIAVLSSFKNKKLPPDWIIFGEIGLSGELRPVPNGQERLKEASKHGFKKAIVPKANCSQKLVGKLQVIPMNSLEDVLEYIRNDI